MTRRPRPWRLAGASLALLICAALGCDGGPHTPTAAPSPSQGNTRHIREIEAVAHASGSPAQTYGVDRAHPLSEVEQAILSAIEDGFRGDLTHDPALSAMVGDLALASPSRFDMPPTLLDALLAWHGVPDPQPAVVVVELQGSDHGCDRAAKPDCQEALDALVDEVLSALGKGRWRVGVGVEAVEGGARTRMMVALVERAIELEPIPVTVGGGAQIEVRGKLLGRRAKPRIERVDPKGGWARLPSVVGSDGSIQAVVPCDAGDGAYQVEVLADGKLGPEVVANFRVFCGVERPSEIRFGYERLGPQVTSADIVRSNFDLLNELREARGLPILAWDEGAAMVAKAHSEDMAANGFVGHVSPKTGDASARFSRAGIVGTVVRENVARGYGPKGIHESLMNSPGHRANLVAADVTHVGIGVVFGEPESTAADAPRPVFLTQNFYAKAGADVPSKPSSALRDRVDDQREAAGLPALRWDAKMNKLAQRRADGAAGLGPGLDDDELREQLSSLGLGALEQHQVGAGSFEDLLALDLWAALAADARVGVGVAQAGADQGLVMVIFVGR
ncbi:Cysteine-rich secretory protein family protein [Enhygromyxa salina]|uniref:Cysteine-rich secretory protein family protein n=1 Tax=Enhygromyxa salina TaxID=215803 RepID=A0A2S9YL50_9BACT|nr:CAP domain-containing protein [Enhygromyxa salina]PRQ05847.1 Cysteine-rich secretory protein family protein [Enhygromyxa salina]